MQLPQSFTLTTYFVKRLILVELSVVSERSTLAPEDDVDIDYDTVMGRLVFAESVTTGETAILTYEAVHTAVTADDDVLTVPETHMEAVIAFVDFRAHWEAESDEAYSASSSTLVLSQLGETGRRAWNRWREVMGILGPVGGWAGGESCVG